MNALDPSSVIPIRMVDPPRRSWREGLGAAAAECAVSLLANIAVVAGLIHVAFPRDLPSPAEQAISVDLVSEPAQPSGAPSAGSGDPQSKTGLGPATKSPPTDAVSTAAKPTSGTSDKKGVEAEPPTDPKSASEPAGMAPASPPAGAAAAEATTAATPPPLDTGRNPTPRLVEAPADPRQSITQSDTNAAANAEMKPAETAEPAEVPPPPSPNVIATAKADAVPVAEPESTATTEAPAVAVTAESRREAENTARLAAALPFSQSYVAAPNRAALSGTGQSNNENFRGAVYGNFRKADDLVEAARAKHLHGQAVVLFSIDDKGSLVSAKIAVSSGDPAVDATALELIRRSAPYPPPPPGAPRVFSPAIGFGQDGP